MRPRLLDLYGCQGGAGMGYHRVGFEVVGIDIDPQPRYPFEFHQEDAIELLDSLVWAKRRGIGNPEIRFDAVHASCPCQFTSATQRIRSNDHPNLIPETRELLEQLGLPYVIENVEDARPHLRDPIMLCGAMFNNSDRGTYRHRLFETNWPLEQPTHPSHIHPQAKMGRQPKPGEWIQVVGNFSDVAYGREVMEMPWASRDGLREAIPPYYTEWIGERLMEHINADRLELAA
jgi:DNA (cytosine-5)-methyltransferase 1